MSAAAAKGLTQLHGEELGLVQPRTMESKQ
jgi:hypothetical protein